MSSESLIEFLRKFPALDERLGVHPVFLVVPRATLLYVKVVLESYEGFGVLRTKMPYYTETDALIVLLIVPDFAEPSSQMLAELAAQGELRIVESEPAWIEELYSELLPGC